MPFVAVVLSCVAALAAAAKPNILFLLTDDVTLEDVEFMPFLSTLAASGAKSSQFFVNVPVCCPSRSGILTGRYQHSTQALNNSIPGNCGGQDWTTRVEPTSFAPPLQAAGYSTFFGGKYLNLYGESPALPMTHVPAGWTEWQGLQGNSVYYGYKISVNGVPEQHGSVYEEDYLPLLLLNRSRRFITNQVAAGTPFFAMVSVPAAHEPAVPPPQYVDAFPGVTAPRTPAFNYTAPDSHWIQAQQAVYGLNGDSIEWLDLLYRRRLQTLLYVDDMLRELVGDLKAAGVWNNTYFVMSSDNGFHTGTFGLAIDKRQPWSTDVHLPLIAVGPGIPSRTVVTSVTSSVDIAATLLDMAGLPPLSTFQGPSMLPLLQGGSGGGNAALIEYHGESGNSGPPSICDKSSDINISGDIRVNFTQPPFFYGQPFCTVQDARNNTYNCLRVVSETENIRYCEFPLSPAAGGGTGPFLEYYDLQADPYELHNLATSSPPTLLARFSAQLKKAVGCGTMASCIAALAG